MKRITLTFDNGPTEKTTPLVLRELKQRQLLAYFCVVGSQLRSEKQISLTCEALNAGHRIVNHSLTHEVPLGDNPSAEHARREIGDMHVLMDEKLGNWGERWFRPFGRGGAIGPHIFSHEALAQFDKLNYSVLLWNSVPRDWEEPNNWVGAAIADIEQQDHTVVVLHDIDTGAMQRLPEFLDLLQNDGVEITQALPDTCVPIRNGKPSFAETELAALVSAD